MKRAILNSLFFLPVHFTYYLRKHFVSKNNTNNVLIIATGGIGDVLSILSPIKALKEKTNANIDILTKDNTKFIFENQPFINKIYTISPSFPFRNFLKYDLCISMEYDFNLIRFISLATSRKYISYDKLADEKITSNKIHFFEIISDLFKYYDINPKYTEKVKVREDDILKIENIIKNNGITNKNYIIGIHYYASKNNEWRSWSRYYLKKYIDLVLKNYPEIKIIITGTQDPEIDHSNVFYINNLTEPQLTYLISKYDLMVSVDSGPMHLAVNQGIRTIGLFGSKPPEVSGPYPPSDHIVIHKLPSYLATWEECYKNSYARHIPMKLITPNEVFKATEKVINCL